MKVTQLPGAHMAPETLLARHLERANAGELVSVMVSVEYQDGSFESSYSVMKAGQAFCHARIVAQAADNAFWPCECEVLPDRKEPG